MTVYNIVYNAISSGKLQPFGSAKTAARQKMPAPDRWRDFGEDQMKKSNSKLGATRLGRRDFLVKSSGALAAGAVGAFNIRTAAAADTVNIGGLYPVTGNFAQIGQGCVNAAKLAVQMVNDAGGIKSLGGAKLNLIVSDVQSDPTVTRTETDRLISSYRPAAIHGAFASALTLIASEVAERAKVPLLTGSSSDQLNKDRHFTFTPFSRASQFALAQLQMSKLVSDQPKVAVIFENTAFGTSTSNGLREQAPAQGVEIVMFEPYSAGLSDASPLINKVKASGANMLFPVSYLNDLILIIRAIKQVDLKIAINGGSGGFVIPDFYRNVGNAAEGLLGVAHWNHDISDNAQKVNAAYQKQFGEFLFEYAGGLVAQTFMIADALERAASTDPQKVRDALAALDVSEGYAAMCPGGKVKFGPDGKNIYAHPVGVQWQHGDLATVFPKEEARAQLIKA
jgi:branched-chain amino acid transport system substrate-binding protein